MKHLKKFTDIVAKNTWLIWATLTAMVALWGAFIELPRDATPLLRDIFTYTSWFGALAVTILPAVRALINESPPSVRDYFFGVAALTTACAFLAEEGDAVIALANAEPIRATAIGISLLLVRWVISVARPSQQTVALDYSQGRLARGVAGVARAIQRSKPTSRDDKSTAAHEAGHALPHAALAVLPEDFVVVMEQNHSTGSLGFVTGVSDGENMLTRRPFAEWRMLMLLGGMAAEKALLGSDTLGGSSDYKTWLATANIYLTNGIRGLFYSEPLGTDQIMANKIALDALQREQETLLAEFFALNLEVLAKLTDELLTKRRLDAEALKPYLTQVRFPVGFPTHI